MAIELLYVFGVFGSEMDVLLHWSRSDPDFLPKFREKYTSIIARETKEDISKLVQMLNTFVITGIREDSDPEYFSDTVYHTLGWFKMPDWCGKVHRGKYIIGYSVFPRSNSMFDPDSPERLRLKDEWNEEFGNTLHMEPDLYKAELGIVQCYPAPIYVPKTGKFVQMLTFSH